MATVGELKVQVEGIKQDIVLKKEAVEDLRENNDFILDALEDDLIYIV